MKGWTPRIEGQFEGSADVHPSGRGTQISEALVEGRTWKLCRGVPYEMFDQPGRGCGRGNAVHLTTARLNVDHCPSPPSKLWEGPTTKGAGTVVARLERCGDIAAGDVLGW